MVVAMQIQAGYKKTDIGIIPNDWDVKKFQDVVAKFIDYRGVTPKKLGMDWGGGDICALSANNVQMGHINFEKECYLASEQLYKRWMRNGDCEQGDILLTMEAPLGNVAFIPNQKKYILSQRAILIKTFEFIEKDFLRHLMMGTFFQRCLSDNASGSTAQGIQRKRLEKIEIHFPKDKREQSAIAKALNDADALITQLEKLIAKKKAIKQGAMQELLKPKEGWEEKKLGDEIDFQGGSQPPLTTFISSAKEGYIRLLQIRDYKTDKYETFIPLKLAKRFCKKDDIMIGRYGPPVFQILKGLEGSYNVALMKAVPSDKVHKTYAYYFLKQDSLLRFIENLSKRTAGQSGIDMKELKEHPFPLPPYDEQMRIAQILSDMDAEIEAQEKKLDKYKMLKQGMMQNLLTGRIRLI
jgi:type I restriction enzyme S subunit